MPGILTPSPFLSRLWLLPLISSITWFATLLSLLSIWIGKGRPRYEGQRNPDIAFISDIAAHELKPVFLVGATVTSLTFLSTISNVHKFRIYAYTESHSRIRGLGSMLSVLTGFVAATSLILMAILDTFRFHQAHKVLLLSYFGGIGICSFLIMVIWVDQILEPGRLRKWCIANSLVVLSGAGISAVFSVMLRREEWHAAGVLEWTVAFLGALWIFTFEGILRFPEVKFDTERTPLLQE